MASSRPKVLLLGTIEAAHTEWTTSITTQADILQPTSQTRTAFLAECATGAFDGALVAYRTFDSVALTGRIDTELLEALPSSLKFICHNGAGYDQIDVAACTARGIRVSNVRTAVDDSTADTAVFLLLGAMRNFAMGMGNLRRGVWRSGEGEAPLVLGREPRGKVLGVLGMGGIGRNFAQKMAAFGMRVRYFNRTRLSEVVEREECGGAEWVDFETLLKESDVLSLHLPLNVCIFPFFSASAFPYQNHMTPRLIYLRTIPATPSPTHNSPFSNPAPSSSTPPAAASLTKPP